MMDGIAVVVLACSIHATPNVADTKNAHCKKIVYTFAESITAMQCIFGAQQQIARQFVIEYPNWSIKRITCQELHRVGPGAEDPNEQREI